MICQNPFSVSYRISKYMKNFITAFVFLSAAVAASAQDALTSEYNYSPFRRIVVNDGFDFSIVNSEDYSVRLSADADIFTYAHAFVKDSTLFLELDSEAFPSDVKKRLSGKDSPVLFLRAEIGVPDIDVVEIHDNAVMDSKEPFTCGNVSLVVDGSAMIAGLEISADCVSLDLTRNSSASVSVKADSLKVVSSALASVTVAGSTVYSAFKALGNSSLTVNCVSDECRIASESAAEVSVSGKADVFSVTGRAGSIVNAEDMLSDKADVSLSMASHCTLGKTDSLSVDLIGGSHLIVDGNPPIQISRILSSSVTHPE